MIVRTVAPLFALVIAASSFGVPLADKTQAVDGGPGSREAASPSSPRAEYAGGGGGAGFGELKEGGSTSPAGAEICCDLPVPLRKKNIGGTDGAGLCVFTSIMHAARYQNEKKLWNFQEQMSHERGGGYPEKVDAMIAKYGAGAKYIQHEGGDLDFLWQAMKTGRPVSITYDGRDGFHYGKQRIAHMVSLMHIDPPGSSPRWYGILDNNFIGENQIVWATEEDFKSRWLGNSGGWGVVLLEPAAPPAPRN